MNITTGFVIAISSLVSSLSGGHEVPLKDTITEPLVIEQEFEFRCEEDMPCSFPEELRISWLEDIDTCSAGYKIPGYYDEFMGCLDEARDFWTTLEV